VCHFPAQQVRGTAALYVGTGLTYVYTLQ